MQPTGDGCVLSDGQLAQRFRHTLHASWVTVLEAATRRLCEGRGRRAYTKDGEPAKARMKENSICSVFGGQHSLLSMTADVAVNGCTLAPA